MMRVVLLALLALALPSAAAGAQEPAAVAERAIGQLRSPYCPGLMLEVCPSSQAAALRDSLRELAAAGASEHELVEWVIGRHGEEWRAVPRRSGRGIWAWLIPPLFLLTGAGLVAARLRRDRSRVGTEPEPAGTLSEEERARLAAAMRAWEADGEGEP